MCYAWRIIYDRQLAGWVRWDCWRQNLWVRDDAFWGEKYLNSTSKPFLLSQRLGSTRVNNTNKKQPNILYKMPPSYHPSLASPAHSGILHRLDGKRGTFRIKQRQTSARLFDDYRFDYSAAIPGVLRTIGGQSNHLHRTKADPLSNL